MVGQSHAWPLYPRGKIPLFPLYRGLGGPQDRSGRVQKYLTPPSGIRSPDRPALRQLVSVLNVKKMDGMKNKMLSQIRALSSNKA